MDGLNATSGGTRTRNGLSEPDGLGGTRGRPEATGVRELAAAGRFDEAWALARAELISGAGPGGWSAARNVLRAGEAAGWSPSAAREARLAVLCSYEAAELRAQLRLACLALGIRAELYDAPYGQLEQELLGDGPLSEFAPTHVLIAPSTADLAFPEPAGDPAGLLDAAESRWRALWRLASGELGARVLQHGFVVPEETALGHLSLRLPGSRISLVRELNRRLAEAAGSDVLLVDTERLAAGLGKRRWLDLRLWYAVRQPFGPEALGVLALETAAVLAADLGLAARCLVVDLDNTLWGGVVGDDGPDRIVVGEGPEGDAYAAFQEYLLDLNRSGLILAVASKNDLDAAQEPFRSNPAMRLRLEHFAAFVADWRPKSVQLEEIADRLGLGLDSLVFADDNPAECAEVAMALPTVTTIRLDVPPSERVRALAASARLEPASLSADDLGRQRSYAGRAQADTLRTSARSLEDFWRSLEMRARVRPVDARSLDRAAQLVQKTNQFNLTLHRRTREELDRFAADARAISLTLELEDRFAHHGMVGVGLAVPGEDDPSVAAIDVLLLSCRVIGRTAETHLISHLSRAALDRGYSTLRGIYVPGPRNSLVADLYPKLGFTEADGGGSWEYDLASRGPIPSHYIADHA
ncbi:MAG: HAD-IIIC family phosphatase [Actinobacteria bacterium]|nr:HAD-IIIC family phosphatase [Actinomycetota bacterium]